jgi:hypothetical protein
MLASSLQLMGHLVSDSIPPRLEVEGHIPCVCITIAAMGQSLVNIAALKKDTTLDQAICHPSAVIVCAYHLGPFLILFPMSLASSPDLYVSDLDFPTVCLICEAESTLSGSQLVVFICLGYPLLSPWTLMYPTQLFPVGGVVLCMYLGSLDISQLQSLALLLHFHDLSPSSFSSLLFPYLASCLHCTCQCPHLDHC